jgi:tripartite ATP-independent transporter DctM subunit
MIFAGISGVSSAETLGIGTILIPAMKREGYPAGFAAGLTAASSTLGNIIPPSLMMIIYAATAGLSVGAMFLSGIVPGLLIGALQMAWSSRVAKRLRIGEKTPFSMRTFGATGRKASAALVIPVLIIGGILGGAFTATEASVIAVAYVLFVAMAGRQLTLKHLFKLTEDSVGMFSLSLLCVAAASLWGWVLAFYGVPQAVVAWLAGLGLLGSKLGIFTVVIFVFLLVGTFMDAVPAIIILQPIVGGIAAAGGIDPYHMGLVVVLTLAIGLLTPPYGLCLLIAADLAEITTVEAVRALVPFYVISLVAVIVAALFPDLMLMIPRMAMAGLAR